MFEKRNAREPSSETHTCKNTNIPPRNQATILAPFLTNTPAQIPATVPKPSSYKDTDEAGGGGGQFSSVHLGCALPLLEPGGATLIGWASAAIGCVVKLTYYRNRLVID